MNRFSLVGLTDMECSLGILSLVWSFRLVGSKCPLPFDKILIPSTTLLHPAYKCNNQMHAF